MKYVLLTIFALLVAWTVVAVRLQPERAPDGRLEMFWVTDNNPARQAQVRAFNEFVERKLATQPSLAPGIRGVDLKVDYNNIGPQKVIVQSLGGIGGDLIDIYTIGDLHDFVRAQIVEPIDPAWAKANGCDPAATWPGVYEQITVDGVQYCFPCNVNCEGLTFWNEDVLRAAGVDLPLPRAMTWETYRNIARKLVRRRDGRTEEPFMLAGVSPFMLIWQAGGWVFNATGTRCTLDSPQAVRAMQLYADLIHHDHIIPTPSERASVADTGGWNSDHEMFAAGRMVSYTIGRWGMINFRKAQYEYDGANVVLENGVARIKPRPLRIIVTLTPVVDLNLKVYPMNARAAGINRKSPNKLLAREFLAYLASDTYNDLIHDAADAFPPLVRKTTHNPLYDYNPKYPLETREMNDVFRESLRYGRPLEISPFIPFTEVWRVIAKCSDRVAGGSMSPRDALTEAANEANRIIASNIRYNAGLRQLYEEKIAIQKEIDAGHRPDPRKAAAIP